MALPVLQGLLSLANRPEAFPGLQEGFNIPNETQKASLANAYQQLINQITGVKAQYAQPMAQEDLRKAQLYNQFYGPNIQSEINQRNALTGETGERTRGLQIENQFMPQEKQARLAEILAKTQQGQQPTGDFTHLPAAVRTAYIDQIVAMGYPYNEAIKFAESGADLGDLAQAKGFERDLSDVPKPQSQITGATKTQLARANMAKAGLDIADDFINSGISHYAGQPTFHNVPLGFYKDSLSGKNKDKQSDFIAATVLAQDQAFLRARMAGAPLSQGLLKHTLETSLTHLKASMPFTKPEVFTEASKKIKQKFDDINAAENQAVLQRPQTKAKQAQKEEGGYSDEDIRHTAQLKGWTEQQVRDHLKSQGGR